MRQVVISNVSGELYEADFIADEWQLVSIYGSKIFYKALKYPHNQFQAVTKADLLAIKLVGKKIWQQRNKQ